MVPFRLARKQPKDYPALGKEAAEAALQDAGLKYGLVEHVVAGYNYGEPTCGQRVAYQLLDAYREKADAADIKRVCERRRS